MLGLDAEVFSPMCLHIGTFVVVLLLFRMVVEVLVLMMLVCSFLDLTCLFLATDSFTRDNLSKIMILITNQKTGNPMTVSFYAQVLV